MRYSFHRFRRLPAPAQIDELNRYGVALDLACACNAAEAVLFAYGDFYVTLLASVHTDEILAINCFKSLKKLEPFLSQVDISEIFSLLSSSH